MCRALRQSEFQSKFRSREEIEPTSPSAAAVLIHSGEKSKESFENIQWRKVKNPMKTHKHKHQQILALGSLEHKLSAVKHI